MFLEIYPVLILFDDPDPMILGTFSPPPGIEFSTGTGASVEGVPESTTTDPPEREKKS